MDPADFKQLLERPDRVPDQAHLGTGPVFPRHGHLLDVKPRALGQVQDLHIVRPSLDAGGGKDGVPGLAGERLETAGEITMF